METPSSGTLTNLKFSQIVSAASVGVMVGVWVTVAVGVVVEVAFGVCEGTIVQVGGRVAATDVLSGMVGGTPDSAF